MSPSLRLERQQQICKNSALMIYFGYFSFPLIDLELKGQIRLYALVVPLKTIPFGAAHTYIAHIGE